MNKPKTVYATLKSGVRIGGTLDPQTSRILVHYVGGGLVGWYSFPADVKLTPATLLDRVLR